MQELIEAYKLTEKLRYLIFLELLLNNFYCRIVSPQPARRDELQAFQTSSYLDCLAAANDYASADEIADDNLIEDLELCGIGN